MAQPWPGVLLRAFPHVPRPLDVEAIEAWIAAGGDVNQKFRDGDEENDQTLLDCAVTCSPERRALDLMRLLISHGADVDAVLRPGSDSFLFNDSCALFHAIEDSRFDALKLLVQAGANVNITNQIEYPLHIALRSPPEFLRVLLLAGARMDSRDYRDRTAEDLAKAAIEREEKVRARHALKEILDEDDSDEELEIYGETHDSRRSIEYNARCHAILKGARLAGSYRLFALQPHISVLVLQALARRGRALPTSETSAVARRLVDAVAGATPVPDALVFHVLTYWLGAADSL